MGRNFVIIVEDGIVNGIREFSMRALCNGKVIRELSGENSIDNILIYLRKWYDTICGGYRVDSKVDHFIIDVEVDCF